MIVKVFVHHMDKPDGYRWAVHLGNNPADLSECMNAGWCPTEMEANLEGEMVGVAVFKALAKVGQVMEAYALVALSSDPMQPIGV